MIESTKYLQEGWKIMDRTNILEEYRAELNRTGKSERTINGYIFNINAFLIWCEETSGEPFNGAITQTEIRAYKSYLDTVKKAALSTINTKLAAVQNFCNFLHVKYGTESIKVQKKKGNTTPKVEVLSKQELFQFLKFVDNNANLLHKTIVYTILHTGMRESEIANLELDDLVNLDSNKGSHIIIRSGKGDKQRSIPISGDYKALLREYIEKRPLTDSKKVFIGNRGTLTENGIYKLVHRLGLQKGLRVYPHLLRHQCLTGLSKNCYTLEDTKALQEIAGHSSAELTMKYYINASEESKKRLTDNLNLFE